MVTARRAASPSRTRAALAVFAMLAVLAAGTACTYVTDSYKENLFSGDSFPTHVETTSGAIVVGLAESGRPARRTAVLDVMSPLTAIDRGPDTQVSVDQRSLTLFGARSPGEPLDHPRARFTSHQVVTLHPCDRGTEVCEIGTPDAPRPFDAILGIDAFASDALRLRMAASQIVILPNIGGATGTARVPATPCCRTRSAAAAR